MLQKNNWLYRKLKYKWYGIKIINFIKYILSRDYFCRKLKINNFGSLLLDKWVIGNNNILTVGKNTCLYKVKLRIQGSNNLISIGENTIIGKDCRILVFGNNLELRIGSNCTFSHDDELLVQEDGSKIIIGNDCQFSHHVNVRTSDAHPIYYSESNTRANEAKNICIGSHVWVGANVILQKGCQIGNGCVVATYSIVNRKMILDEKESKQGGVNIPATDVVIAGIPAKIVKEGIYWERDFN